MKRDISNTLIDAGLKITPTRLAILEVFTADCKPVNAEYIFNKLKNKNVNLVTIYRTLATFAEKDILQYVNLNADSAHYELAKHHHHHLICNGCGVIEEIGICSELLNKNALAQSNKFKLIEDHSVEFFGICKKCQVKY